MIQLCEVGLNRYGREIKMDPILVCYSKETHLAPSWYVNTHGSVNSRWIKSSPTPLFFSLIEYCVPFGSTQ